MIKQLATKVSIGVVTSSVAVLSLNGLASAAPMTQYYMANMTSLNNSGASGTTYVAVSGNQAIVTVVSKGLSANLPHAQHIHIGGQHACPTAADDANHDGLLSTSEGMNAYGDALIGLTTTGDVSVNSELAVDRYPVAANDGTVTYQRTFTLPDGVKPADMASGVVVQHGVSTLFNDPTMYDGTAKDVDTSPTLPLEATIPADCAPLVNVTAQMMSGTTNYAADFNKTIGNALVQLQNNSHTSANVTTGFIASYNQATTQFKQTLLAAATKYDETTMTNSGAAKDTFIDAINNAKATYFNQLEVARNNIVASLSGSNDAAKDSFVNSYNSARDLYSNQIEMVKNDFTAMQQ